MRPARIALATAAALLVLIGGSVGALRAGALATDPVAAKARWAAAPSRFVTVDGVVMHVLAEGPPGAPVVVMLHGSIANLHEWDLVADRLKGRYRVVRFDWPPYGLSGPDTAAPTTPRAAQLMNGLLTQMGIARFALVATSNGANVALEYNRLYPGHAIGMAFSMLPLERPSQTRKGGAWMQTLVWLQQWVPNWHSHAFYRAILTDTDPPGFEPADWMVDSIYDADNLPGAAARQRAYLAANVGLFKTDIISREAAAVRVPVLLQWCAFDTVISQSADASVKRFVNAPVELIRYPDLGHFPFWQNPDRFTRDLVVWLDKVTRAPAAKAP